MLWDLWYFFEFSVGILIDCLSEMASEGEHPPTLEAGPEESNDGKGDTSQDEDFSDIAEYHILSMTSTDRMGNPVFCFKASCLPPRKECDYDKLLRYMKTEMDTLVESDYSIIYLHHGLTSKNKPSLKWLRQVYGKFDRRYKKNLKALHVVHPSTFVKVCITLFKPLISKKFGRKLHMNATLSQLSENFFVDKLDVPPTVKVYDEKIQAGLTKKGKKAGGDAAAPAEAVGTVFGAYLEAMEVSATVPDVPQVVVDIATHITDTGIDTEGIFRRSVSLAVVRQIKADYNAGRPVDLAAKNDVQLSAVLLKSFFRAWWFAFAHSFQ
eukprot:m.677310 g.677310  ORF g.677310 m.677310 type:complete len:324 (+) comp22795_c0_seq9:202-1173(+)